jgi:hypothetical protein
MQFNNTLHASAALPLGKEPVTNLTGNWTDPRPSLNISAEKTILTPLPVNKIWNLQPIA